MVEMNTQGDVFSTVEPPKQDSAANQAVVMPTIEHPLKEDAAALDQLFWAKSVGPAPEPPAAGSEAEESKEESEWAKMRAWLVHFDLQYKSAIILMGKAAADETKPF